jgi:hypothetical protein
MFDSYKKGQIASLKVQLRATELGYTVSIPTVESRYDLLIDDGTKIQRVQVKYCDRSRSDNSGSVELDLRKQCRGWGKRKPYTRAEVDAVVVYIAYVDRCYWLPAEKFDGVKSITLRLDTPKRLGKVMHFAKEYEF